MRDLTMWIARGLAALWAGFWLFVFVVESLAWNTPLAVMAPWVAAGLVFVLLAVVSWRLEFAGGILLVTAGTLCGLAYLIWSPAGLAAWVRLLTAATLGGPPVLAGLLLLAHHHGVHTLRRPA